MNKIKFRNSSGYCCSGANTLCLSNKHAASLYFNVISLQHGADTLQRPQGWPGPPQSAGHIRLAIREDLHGSNRPLQVRCPGVYDGTVSCPRMPLPGSPGCGRSICDPGAMNGFLFAPVLFTPPSSRYHRQNLAHCNKRSLSLGTEVVLTALISGSGNPDSYGKCRNTSTNPRKHPTARSCSVRGRLEREG